MENIAQIDGTLMHHYFSLLKNMIPNQSLLNDTTYTNG